MTTPVRVGVTVEQLWQPTPGGSGTYVQELVAGLHDRADVDVLGLAARGHTAHAGLPDDLPVRTAAVPRRPMYEAWRRLPVGPVVPALVGPATGDLDVVHATTWAVPPTSAPLVVTVHDLAFLRDASHFTRHGAAFFRSALRTTRRRAAAVVVPSRTTADDCVRHGVAADRIHVVPHGVRPHPVTAADVDAWRAGRRLDGPYVLWCGTLEPRKNLERLVAAHAASAVARDLDLVLVGPQGWGGTSDRLRAMLETGRRVHVLGRLSDHDLACAYAGAAVLAFPSLWEGFGLPVLEALAHGTPVVTSAGTSTAELVTPACGVLVDPTSEAAVAAGLDEAVRRRDELAAGALDQAARYDWSASVAAHAELYRAVAS